MQLHDLYQYMVTLGDYLKELLLVENSLLSCIKITEVILRDVF